MCSLDAVRTCHRGCHDARQWDTHTQPELHNPTTLQATHHKAKRGLPMNAERRAEVLDCIGLAIPSDPNEATDASKIPDTYVQDALDELWNLLDLSKSGADSVVVLGVRPLPLKALRRLALKLTTKHNTLPTSFYLEGVTCEEKESRGAGGFADVYCGEWGTLTVALKRLRVEAKAPEVDRKLQMDFCRESLLWRKLDHRHVLPFLGVSKDAFQLTICMVLPWLDGGNIRHHIDTLRGKGELSRVNFVPSVNNWLYQIALGLTYLHREGIVHGDLHGGNILIDTDGNVRLTDFGMGLIADATAHNYGSKHGGGAFQYTSPELHDPEEFGLESSRPTSASDVYAFACICVELYSGQAPFADLKYFKVCIEVLNGKRPSRPSTVDGDAMSNSMWFLTRQCWDQLAAQRPTAETVADNIKIVISGGELDGSENLPEEERAVEARPNQTTGEPSTTKVEELATNGEGLNKQTEAFFTRAESPKAPSTKAAAESKEGFHSVRCGICRIF